MPSASIGNASGIKTGNFQLIIQFEEPVGDFSAANVRISVNNIPMTEVGNGVLGINPFIYGMGTVYYANFDLPDDVQGKFRFELIGSVTPESGSSPEAIMSSSAVIAYNNISNITASFGTYTVDTDGNYIVPITFGEPILYVSKSDFRLRKVSGSEIFDFDFRIAGTGGFTTADGKITGITQYQAIIIPPDNRKGVLDIDMSGYVHVIRTDGSAVNHVLDDVEITTIRVEYNTMIPEIDDYSIPGIITEGIWDVYIDMNIPIRGFGTDKLIQEGANLSMPTIYRHTNLTATSRPARAVVPDPIPDNQDDFAETIDDVDGNEDVWVKDNQSGTPDLNDSTIIAGKFFLLRFKVSAAQAASNAIYSITLKPHSVWGPNA